MTINKTLIALALGLALAAVSEQEDASANSDKTDDEAASENPQCEEAEIKKNAP